jgi:hypothetical protein
MNVVDRASETLTVKGKNMSGTSRIIKARVWQRGGDVVLAAWRHGQWQVSYMSDYSRTGLLVQTGALLGVYAGWAIQPGQWANMSEGEYRPGLLRSSAVWREYLRLCRAVEAGQCDDSDDPTSVDYRPVWI